MGLPASMLTNACDIHRPFGAATPTVTGILCRLTPDLVTGSKGSIAGLVWTHTLDLQPDADIRDGCSRTTGTDAIDFADGDEIRTPNGDQYVVVWVETVGSGTPLEHQRAYLLRHQAA